MNAIALSYIEHSNGLAANPRILNGRAGDDRGIGKFTFVGSRGSSVVDYILASQNLFDYVSKFKVHDPNLLSDHCLITFSFEFGNEEITDSLLMLMANLFGKRNSKMSM